MVVQGEARLCAGVTKICCCLSWANGFRVGGKSLFFFTHLHLLLVHPRGQGVAQLAVDCFSRAGVSLKHAGAVEEEAVDLIHLET